MCCKRTRICTSRTTHATISIAYGGYHRPCGITIKYEGSRCFSACLNCSTNHYWFSPRKTPEVLQKLKVSLNWTRRFMRSRLNWRFQKPTTVKDKFPTDWVNQGYMMTLRIAYLVKLYNITPSLVVNTDQTSIHLVPLARDRTWENKGSKDIGIIGGDDKRAITACVSSAANGLYFRFNSYFQGLQRESYPKLSEDGKALIMVFISL